MTLESAAILSVRDWLATRYLEPATMQTVAAELAARPSCPLLLQNFMLRGRAEAMSGVISELSNWRASRCVLGANGGFEEVSEQEWEATPARLRRTRQDLARPLAGLFVPGALPAKTLQALEEFLIFCAFGPALRCWLQALISEELIEQVSLELARYQPGDFLAPHTDLGGNRVLAVNIYLGRDSQAGGGRLGFRNERGEVFELAPNWNSASLVPVRAGCEHWVTPWQDSSAGRETVCLGFAAVRSTEKNLG